MKKLLCTILVLACIFTYVTISADTSIAEHLDHQQLVVCAQVWTPNATALFQQRYPEIDLNLIDESITAEELAEMMVLKDNSIDIFEICADYSYSTLVSKDFTLNLSSFQMLCDQVAEMYSVIANVLKNKNGDIVAYPAELRLWSTSIHTGFWRLVFGDRPIPTTMDEFLDAWIDYESEYADLYPDIQFCISVDFQDYCEKIITFYAQQNDDHREGPSVNTSELRNVLLKFEEVIRIRQQNGRYTSSSENPHEDRVASMFRFRGWNDAMYSDSFNVALTSENTLYDLYMWDYTEIPLNFTYSSTPQTDGTLYVYVINPYSRNIDVAIKYLECVAELESEPYIYYAIHPECNDPYEWPSFEQEVASIIQDKKALEDALIKLQASGTNQTDEIQAMIDYCNLFLQDIENERWMISAETIKTQREMMQHLHLHTDLLFTVSPGSRAEQMLSQLCKRYVEGNISIDMLLRELESKLNMMKMENQ